MHSTPPCRFAAPHTICGLQDLPNTRLHIRKARLFLSMCIAVHIEEAGAASVSLKKSTLETLELTPWGKFGRFCVLMIGRVFGHRKLFVFRTAATVHPPYWQNGGSYSPDLTATDWLLVPATQKPVRQQGVPSLPDPSPKGSQDTRSTFAAAGFNGKCLPPLSQSWDSNRKISSHAASY